MKKHLKPKTISASYVFYFFLIIATILLITPISTRAASLNWDNPNSKTSPYKIKVTDIVNTELFGQILGCTGFVDNISGKLTDLTAAAWDHLVINKLLKKKLIAQCEKSINKVATVIGSTETSQTPSAGKVGAMTALTKALCETEYKTEDGEFKNLLVMRASKKEKASQDWDQCLKGVGYTLAKNQLTSMARYAINWVNTGFGGDPFFVQNTQNFMQNIERGVFERSLNYLMPTPEGTHPRSRSFARSIASNRSLGKGALSSLSNLTSNLSDFVTDIDSYANLTLIQKEKKAINLFNEDFNRGGWPAYSALFINANNPLDYELQASQIIAGSLEVETKNLKEELSQNNGFLSQKKCVKYSREDPPFCEKWEVVTPGSLIRDKISMYLNSPERQLELADDINKVLNSVFSNLINKLESQGLTGINKRETFVYNDDRFNWSSSVSASKGFEEGESLTTGYTNGSFDLTRDLGNRFIFEVKNSDALGTWDAFSNKAVQKKNGATEILIEGRGPLVINTDGSKTYPSNVYYTVSKAGRAKLYDNGYTHWNVGDRAFWDGESWQNWKKCKTDNTGKCSPETFPIKKRGVIQIQYDYIVAVKEMLQLLPSIMPKIGELDYCLPGPNRGWLLNITEIEDKLMDFVYSLKSVNTPSKFLKRGFTEFSIAKPGDNVFDNYVNLFKNSPTMLNSITTETSSYYTGNLYDGTFQLHNIGDLTYGLGKIASTSTWKEIIKAGNMRREKINLKEQHLLEKIDMLINSIEDGVSQFEKEYASIIDFLYGPNGLVNIEYFLHEDTAEKIENTAYIPVGKVGYPIAGQIFEYDEEIKEKMESYRDNIATVQAGVYELEKIKVEVDKIIKNAQERRDKRLLEAINEKAKQEGVIPLTLAAYKNKYRECLATEKIVFYDDLEIMNNASETEDRCFDGIDNDFDGLTDKMDPDCAKHYRGDSSGGNNLEDEWAFGRGIR